MANTKYAYVRNFELPDPLLPGTFLLLRLDGQSFHRFSETHSFTKPNDVRALKLMDRAARELMDLFPDIVLAFGESDEYSFLLKKSTTLFNRRQAKILSTLVSAFTGFYMFYWGEYFGGKSNGGEGKGGEEEGKEEGEEEVKMQYPASFDGRIVVYPSEKEVKDYFRWRQADTHINNLYNTVFWALVKSGKTTTEAHAVLKGTYSKDKHEILFTQFGINYNNIDARFRKGSILVREVVPEEEEIEHNQNDSTPGPSSSTPSHGPDQPSSSQSTDPPPPSQDPSLQPPHLYEYECSNRRHFHLEHPHTSLHFDLHEYEHHHLNEYEHPILHLPFHPSKIQEKTQKNLNNPKPASYSSTAT
ncbi:tRNA guanylyltransferase [Coprinopsis cinerea AmutBmut pab1-1]|nr:tRNA guanylyltransferase [Coprinopsis cinerea AmutBmut pab1-1]